MRYDVIFEGLVRTIVEVVANTEEEAYEKARHMSREDVLGETLATSRVEDFIPIDVEPSPDPGD